MNKSFLFNMLFIMTVTPAIGDENLSPSAGITTGNVPQNGNPSSNYAENLRAQAATVFEEQSQKPPSVVEMKENASKSNDIDYAENLRAQAATVFREQLEKMHDLANSTKSPDARNIRGFVLATEVRSFREIPENIDREIQAIRESIRVLVFKVATDIEQHGSGSIKIENGQIQNVSIDLPKDAVDEYARLMEAKQKNNVSVRSIQLAIQMLSNLNKQLMIEAEKEVDKDKKRKLYITQAALVYEMSDIVCEFLGKISLEGKDEIYKISTQHQEQIRNRIGELDDLIKKARQASVQGIIEPTAATMQEKTFNYLKAANETTLKMWEDIVQRVSKQESALENIKSKVQAVELVRDSAKLQLATLRDITVVGEFNSIIGDMTSLVAGIEGLQLLELTPEVVSTLLFGRPVHE